MPSPDLLDTAGDLTVGASEIPEFEKPFQEYYDREIRPVADELTAERTAALAEAARRRRKGWLIWFPIAVFIGVIASILMKLPALALAVMVGTIILIYAHAGAVVDVFDSRLKRELLPRVIAYFPGFRIQSRFNPDTMDMMLSSIVPMGDFVNGRDRLTGNHDGTDLSVSEVSTYETKRDSKGNKRQELLFYGLFIAIEFEKPFHGKTLVERETDGAPAWLDRLLGDKSLQPVSLEDPSFEKKFRVRSTDQTEARFLLTPDFMHRLDALASRRELPGMCCSFVGQKFYMTISTYHDYFEISGAKSDQTIFEQALSLYRDIAMVTRIIDILRINADRGVRSSPL